MNWNTLNKLFLGALALSLSLGQLTRFELPIGGALYVHDVLLIGWTEMLLFKMRINDLQNVLKH